MFHVSVALTPPQQAALSGGTQAGTLPSCCFVCKCTHGAVARPLPLCLLIGSLAVIDSQKLISRASPQRGEALVDLAGSRGGSGK